jgi:hypothetical protein
MDEYSTTNLYQGAALVASGFELIRLDYGFNGKMEFVFQESETMNEVVTGFINGKLVLNIENFISAWRRLRRAIDERGNGNGNGKFIRR